MAWGAPHPCKPRWRSHVHGSSVSHPPARHSPESRLQVRLHTLDMPVEPVEVYGAVVAEVKVMEHVVEVLL